MSFLINILYFYCLIQQLCDMVSDILIEESNIQPVSTPVTVCGDIHGQFYDLEELFRAGGQVTDTNYIFLVSHVVDLKIKNKLINKLELLCFFVFVKG